MALRRIEPSRELPNIFSGDMPFPVVAERFLDLKIRIDDLTAEQAEFKKRLHEILAEAEPDESGHRRVALDTPFGPYVALVRQRRVSRKVDEDAAREIVERAGLVDRLYKLVPVLDEDEVFAAMNEGLLSPEDVDAMFPVSETFAVMAAKK